MSDPSLERRLERIETQLAYTDLCSRYVHGVDKKELDTFAGCWTDDATWNLGPAWGSHTGLEMIVENVSNLHAAFFEMHHGTTNHQVTEYHEGAGRGRCDALVPGTDAAGVANVSCASYEDRFVRGVDGEWRFTRRDITIHYLVPWLKPHSIDEITRGYSIGQPA